MFSTNKWLKTPDILGDFPVLDLFRYQRSPCRRAVQMGIAMVFLPAYSREPYLIERPWKVAQRRAFCGGYHPTYATQP